MTARPTSYSTVTSVEKRSLLDLVDVLTKSQNVANWQGTRIVRRRDPALLDWLQNLITSDIGGSGSGKLSHERAPLDIAAMETREEIDGRIRAWLVDLGARPGREVTPAQALRSWYVLWMANPTHKGDERLQGRFVAILEGWEKRILAHIDPPKPLEIESPCPACGADWVNVGLDENDVERVRAIVVQSSGPVSTWRTQCASCGESWAGEAGMRELRIAIDAAAANAERERATADDDSDEEARDA